MRKQFEIGQKVYIYDMNGYIEGFIIEFYENGAYVKNSWCLKTSNAYKIKFLDGTTAILPETKLIQYDKIY